VTHSRKILSQAGTSLADVYDVEGSIVGLENLDVTEIKGVHDLGPQIHSERLLSFNLIADSTALAQNLTWDVVLGAIPDSINRILSIIVVSGNGARVSHCQISITDPAGVDHPVWIWTASDIVSNIRWQELTGTIVTAHALRPTPGATGSTPTIISRMGNEAALPTLSFRGLTTGFGAGTVRTRALILIARPDRGAPAAGEPSSHGLPIPSW